MSCPLCDKPLRRDGPVLYRVWMEMESNDETIVGIHLSCAWTVVREWIYDREEAGATPDYTWIGWEPMDDVAAVAS